MSILSTIAPEVMSQYMERAKTEIYDRLWRDVIMPEVIEDCTSDGNKVRRLKIQGEDPTYLRIKIIVECTKRGLDADYFFHRLLFEAKDRVLVEQILKEIFPDRVKAYKKVLDNINV